MERPDQEALLYFFEDTEAVIKMIIKGRSPTMRHVSRTHRVALDWLFDRINLDPKIQIKHIDTKNYFADIPTKGNVTRDEWINLLYLFNISFSHISSLHQKFQLDLLHYDDKKNLRTKMRKGSIQVATCSECVFLSYCHKFFCRVMSDCIKESGNVWSIGETWQ